MITTTNSRINVTIISPWYTYNKKLKALFEKDDEVTVYDINETDELSMVIVVSNKDKYIALSQILPKKVVFGNVTLTIYLKTKTNEDAIANYTEIYRQAFLGNRAVKDIKMATDMFGYQHCFVRFQPEVVQFHNDDISDYSGNWSGLNQEIAKEVFVDAPAGIHFCTADLRENELEGQA